jgi:RES domain-containing protein
VDIDELLISAIDVGELPRGWNGDPPPLECQRLGDEWAASLGSVVLRVPSAIVPSESNFLLNPRHPEFSRLRIGNPVPFRFDPRFVR